MLKSIVRNIPYRFAGINNPNYYTNLPRHYSFDTICKLDDPELIYLFHIAYMKYVIVGIPHELHQDIPVLAGGIISHKLNYPLINLGTYKKCKRSLDILEMLAQWIYCYSDNKLLGELADHI